MRKSFCLLTSVVLTEVAIIRLVTETVKVLLVSAPLIARTAVLAWRQATVALSLFHPHTYTSTTTENGFEKKDSNVGYSHRKLYLSIVQTFIHHFPCFYQFYFTVVSPLKLYIDLKNFYGKPC